jgi:hypothetical protein
VKRLTSAKLIESLESDENTILRRASNVSYDWSRLHCSISVLKVTISRSTVGSMIPQHV